MKPSFRHLILPVASLTHAFATSPDESPLWTHQELTRFPAAEAHQGVAVDATHFYAITNTAIGKYAKTTGENVGGWQARKNSPFKHLNAGVVFNWHGSVAISAHGQAFAWDRSDPGILYSIDRKSREVIVSRITRSASNPAPSSAVAPPPD